MRWAEKTKQPSYSFVAHMICSNLKLKKKNQKVFDETNDAALIMTFVQIYVRSWVVGQKHMLKGQFF